MRRSFLFAAMVFWATRALALDLDGVLVERPIVEGLGIEGILTVFDETPRMYKSLGEPTKKGATQYVYKGRSLSLVIEAPFAEKRFGVVSIGVRGRDARIRSGAGVHLGDGEDRVIAILGLPEQRTTTELAYPQTGVSFVLGKGRTDDERVVVGIDVRRAVVPADGPHEPVAAVPDAVPAPAVAPVAPALDFTLAGLTVPLSERWSAQAPLTAAGGVVRTATGTAEVRVEACTSCAAAVESRVHDREAELGPNRVPADKRTLDAASKTAMGVDDGYAGLYAPVIGLTPTWLLALRKGDRTWLVTIAILAPAEPEVLGDVAAILRGLRAIAPELPP